MHRRTLAPAGDSIDVGAEIPRDEFHRRAVGTRALWRSSPSSMGWCSRLAGREVDLLMLPETALTAYVSGSAFEAARRKASSRGVEQLLWSHSTGCGWPVIEQVGALALNTTVGVSASGERWLHFRKRPRLPRAGQ